MLTAPFCVLQFTDPSREETLNSPIVENHAATSGFTHQHRQRPPSPIMDDPGVELERELADTCADDLLGLLLFRTSTLSLSSSWSFLALVILYLGICGVRKSIY